MVTMRRSHIDMKKCVVPLRPCQVVIQMRCAQIVKLGFRAVQSRMETAINIQFLLRWITRNSLVSWMFVYIMPLLQLHIDCSQSASSADCSMEKMRLKAWASFRKFVRFCFREINEQAVTFCYLFFHHQIIPTCKMNLRCFSFSPSLRNPVYIHENGDRGSANFFACMLICIRNRVIVSINGQLRDAFIFCSFFLFIGREL